MGNPYINFVREAKGPARKTEVVHVVNKKSLVSLGVIKWHGAWRQYCFMPAALTIFNKGCMESINEEIDRLMAERRQPTN